MRRFLDRLRRPWVPVALAIGIAATAVVALPQPASAVPMTVRVTIERIRALEGFEGFPGGSADFYAVVTIDGQEFDNEDTPDSDNQEDDDDISPNWEFSRAVDHSRGTVPVSIEIRDEDGFLRAGDDLADVDPTGGSVFDLSVTLAPCALTGDVGGACSSTLVSSGNGNADANAELSVRIEVTEPPSAPGLRAACTHAPVWPQPNQPVTITANALDGNLNPMVADRIEIWVNDRNAPAATTTGNLSLAHTTAPFAGPSFAYGCRIVDGGVTVFTGWRVVQVGTPPDQAVPVLFTGPRSSRIDVVFVPDKDSYSGPLDGTFLADVGTVINAYYGEDVFLRHQDKFNFWIARDTGDAQNDCDTEPPDNWDDDYTFAEAGPVVHRDGGIRDCHPGGETYFSGNATRMDGGRLGRVFLHETGHQPFGLADEYCCDGGYFQADPFPNLYEEPEDCAEDAGNLGRPDSACREFEEDDGWLESDWSTSEPASNDLMVDNMTAQAADVRRIEWLLGTCQAAAC